MAKKHINFHWKPEILRKINLNFNNNWWTARDFFNKFEIQEKRDIQEYSMRFLRLHVNNWLHRKKHDGLYHYKLSQKYNSRNIDQLKKCCEKRASGNKEPEVRYIDRIQKVQSRTEDKFRGEI